VTRSPPVCWLCANFGGDISRRLGQIVSRGRRRWLIRVFLGRDRETRKRRYHNRTIHGSARRAQEYLTKMLRERDLGRGLEGSEITLDAYLTRWLDTAAKPKLRQKSYRSYESLLRRYIRPVLGERILSTVTPLDVQAACQQMVDRRLSSRTIRYTHSVLRSAMRQAIRWRLLIQDPTEGVQLPRLGRREMRVLNAEQSRIFIRAALKTHYGPVFALALTSGMRPSEYLGLQWRDADWARGTVGIVRTLEKTAGQWRFAETKRTRSRRIVKLQTWVVGILRRLQATISKSGKREAPDEPELIFRTATGRPINSDKLAKKFKAILRHAGLPTIRLYDLRHTAATLALSAGVPPKVVAEQLGHASAAFTLDVYSHLLPHMQEEAATKVEQILAGPLLLEHERADTKHSPETGSKKPPKSANKAPEASRIGARA
jgi:integrase